MRQMPVFDRTIFASIKCGFSRHAVSVRLSVLSSVKTNKDIFKTCYVEDNKMAFKIVHSGIII